VKNFDISNLPAPFPGWNRYSEEKKKVSLLERWKSHEWDFFLDAKEKPRFLCGRRSVNGIDSIHFWGGQDLTQFELEEAWSMLNPDRKCWITCAAPAPRMHNVVDNLIDVGDVCEFVFDFTDTLFPISASSSVSSLDIGDFEAVYSLANLQNIRSREKRAGLKEEKETFFNYWSKLCDSHVAPVGAYRNNKLVGLLHISLWSEGIKLWNTNLCAIHPEEEGNFSIIQDMLLAFEGRLGKKIDALKVGLPIESSSALSSFMKAEPSSIWVRKIFLVDD
tara:strand:- start:1620 stop:2450 length:831 start_codon:yes stop_codon:yes gene_type:complete